MTETEYQEKDHEHGRVVLDALKLQHSCEMAGVPVQAAQAREIRRQATQRHAALYITSAPPPKQNRPPRSVPVPWRTSGRR